MLLKKFKGINLLYNNKIWQTILDFLFPKKCIICQKEGSYLCDDCLSLVNISPRQFCPFCQKISPDGATCNNCSRKHYLDGITSVASYDDSILKKAILAYKYPPYLRDLKYQLSFLIISYIKLYNNNFINKFKDFIIVAVPSHKSRLKNRGFDPVRELAEEFSRITNLMFYPDVLIKIKDLPSQTLLSKSERILNPQGAFQINDKFKKLIKNRNILVFDDIFTTGSTMDEIAKTLKGNGANKVWGFSLAREFLKNNYSK